MESIKNQYIIEQIFFSNFPVMERTERHIHYWGQRINNLQNLKNYNFHWKVSIYQIDTWLRLQASVAWDNIIELDISTFCHLNWNEIVIFFLKSTLHFESHFPRSIAADDWTFWRWLQFQPTTFAHKKFPNANTKSSPFPYKLSSSEPEV